MKDDRYFLIIRDRFEGTTQVAEFTDGETAYLNYVETEAKFRSQARGLDPRIEVVLIGGESEQAVREMYPRYFTPGTREERRQRLLEGLEAPA